jgi:hypothetical protein
MKRCLVEGEVSIHIFYTLQHDYTPPCCGSL